MFLHKLLISANMAATRMSSATAMKNTMNPFKSCLSFVAQPTTFFFMKRSSEYGSLDVRPFCSQRNDAPTEVLKKPEVGVGVIVFRHLRESANGLEVLLIRRGKPPSLGKWSFPGGRQELGETLIETAIREAREETGLLLRQLPTDAHEHLIDVLGTLGAASVNRNNGGQIFMELESSSGVNSKAFAMRRSLLQPVPFTAVDVIDRRDDGTIAFHYAIIEVAALPKDYRQDLEVGDDAVDARWMPVVELASLEDLVPLATDVVAEAMKRFDIPIE